MSSASLCNFIAMNKVADAWNEGDPYEYFMGRWSKLIAPLFLSWLNAADHLSWLDIGCGTGALSEAIYRNCNPAVLSCVDPSAGFLEKTKARLSGKGEFAVGSASNIPKPDASVDMMVSGLALNFFPELANAVAEMRRVVKRNGTVAAYVWDYSDRMDFLRVFWDAAVDVDPNAYELDEGKRFPICNVNKLRDEFHRAGLANIETSNLDATTTFKDFDDYWNPFLGGQGPAGSYLLSLDAHRQDAIKRVVFKSLPIERNGSITLLARAIAVRGVRN